MPAIRLCKNPLCSNIVIPSKNKGIEKKYCSLPCNRRYQNRMYYEKQKRVQLEESRPDPWDRRFSNEERVEREYPRDAKLAERRFKDHLGNCQKNAGGPCPSRLDPYDVKKLCLVHAVLNEDWHETRSIASGMEPWERRLTTKDGRWSRIPRHDAEDKAFLEAASDIATTNPLEASLQLS